MNKLATIEAEARNAKRGLWADPEPVAPWTWRTQQREKQKQLKAADLDNAKSNSVEPWARRKQSKEPTNKDILDLCG